MDENCVSQRAQNKSNATLSMRKSQRRVLLALGWYDYRLHRGIEKFAQEHGWYLSANLTREKVIP